ncbi:unnamed protein product [Effrenium voratum]|uniref:Uncharacterized protein n=1 Tax=Effrenium voratum TaxID=2562239 RepID=A0AA36JHU5_9DINO|nr:unnamed protein product [Effrenium voratum]
MHVIEIEEKLGEVQAAASEPEAKPEDGEEFEEVPVEEGVEGMREVPKTEEEPEAPDWAAPTSPADPAEEEAAPPPVTVASSLSSVSDGPSYEETLVKKARQALKEMKRARTAGLAPKSMARLVIKGAPCRQAVDRRLLLIGLLRFFQLAAKGILIHGPLLGWAKVVGDSIFCYEQTVPNRQETISYLMPRRHGLEFGLYPWHAHLKDAVKGTKGMLTALGEWHHAVQDVREAGLTYSLNQADLTNLATTQLQINQTMRQRALAGVNQPHQLPAQTVLHILDEGEMRRNTYEFLEQRMSVWLQSLGQFFWVFVINEANSMECYKVMGETVEGSFCVYDVKPVPMQMNMISTWSIRSGLFSKEADQYYAHFIFLQRPPLTAMSQPPKLHMWRCLTYPDSLADMLNRQDGCDL